MPLYYRICFLTLLLPVFLLIQSCDAGEKLSSVIFQNLSKIDSFAEAFQMHRQSEAATFKHDMFTVEATGTYAYIAHLGWNVVVAFCSENGTVRQAYLFTAKNGYNLGARDDKGVRLVLKKHPGTGMFYGQLLRIDLSESPWRICSDEDGRVVEYIPVYEVSAK